MERVTSDSGSNAQTSSTSEKIDDGCFLKVYGLGDIFAAIKWYQDTKNESVLHSGVKRKRDLLDTDGGGAFNPSLGSWRQRRPNTASHEKKFSEHSLDLPGNEVDGPTILENHDQTLSQNDTKDDVEKLSLKSFNQIVMTFKQAIREMQVPEVDKNKLIRMISILQEKNHLKPITPREEKFDQPHPKTLEEVTLTLRSKIQKEGDGAEEAEEDIHPWLPATNPITTGESVLAALPALPNDGIVYRAWDDRSQCRIRHAAEGFLSGSHYQHLRTRESRKIAVQRHANWSNRKKTPFISATSSLNEIAEQRVPHFEDRQKKAGDKSVTKLTIINANVCLEDGLPLLRMKTELKYYDAKIPYAGEEVLMKARNEKALSGKTNERLKKAELKTGWVSRRSFFANEYLFLFRIPQAHIVGTWLWEDIEQWMKDNHTTDVHKWNEEVGIPAFKAHELARNTGGLATLHGPNCTCCGH